MTIEQAIDIIERVDICCNQAETARDMAIAGLRKMQSGRWVEWWPPKHMILTGEEMLFRCSECDAKYSDVQGYRHCPNCGRPMEVAK